MNPSSLPSRLTQAVQAQARHVQGEPVILSFSAGKDAIVSADLWRHYHDGPQYWVYYYFVDGMEIVERSLRYYEKKWNIEILRRPCHETLSMLGQRKEKGTKRKFSRGDVDNLIREELGLTWIVNGTRRSDSLAVRGMLKGLQEHGIDSNSHKLYPVIDWKNEQIFTYCRMNKLMLPITYSMGAPASVWIPDAVALTWLKTNFRGDYNLVVKQFPELEHAIFKLRYGGQHG